MRQIEQDITTNATIREAAKACTCINLRKTARAVTQVHDQLLRPLGLKATQFGVLVALAASGAVAIGQLAEILAMERTTLTRNLRPLTKRGLVAMGRATRDRRVRLVELTPTGRDALLAALPAWRQAQDRILQVFGLDAWDLMRPELARMTATSSIVLENRDPADGSLGHEDPTSVSSPV